jgi:probable rRNA maturation factor
MALLLTNEQTRPVKTALLRKVSRRLLREENLSRAQVSILLTDDAAIRELNAQYRGYDKPTDVLSFSQIEAIDDGPPCPTVPGEQTLLGDVVISVDTAYRQAAEHQVTIELELALLAVHGILHLLGNEDETEAGAQNMHRRERSLLNFTFPAAALPE